YTRAARSDDLRPHSCGQCRREHDRYGHRACRFPRGASGISRSGTRLRIAEFRWDACRTEILQARPSRRSTVNLVVDIASWFFLLTGAGFMLVSALGMLRLPDIFTRLHGASLADT